jgi:hypothetical protein
MTTQQTSDQLPIYVDVDHRLDAPGGAREASLLAEVLSDPDEMGVYIEVNVGDMRVRLLADSQGTIDVTAARFDRKEDDFGTLHPPGGTMLHWNYRARPAVPA